MMSFSFKFTIVTLLMSTVMVSIGVGMTTVLFPLLLEHNKVTTTLIGLILSGEVASVIVMGRLLPYLLSHLGIAKTLYIGMLIRLCALSGLSFFVDIYSWFIFVFISGVGSFTFFITTQTWLNTLDVGKHRGLVTGIYSVSISVGMALGPLLIRFTGIYGWLPLVVSGVLGAFIIIPLFFVQQYMPHLPLKERQNLWSVIKLSPGAMGSGIITGLTIFGLMSFLTLYGLRNGMSYVDAALLVSIFMAGSISLEIPLAWVSDLIDKRFMIFGATVLSLVCSALLPVAIYTPYLLWVLLFFWGGIIGSVYNSSLALIGERFDGDKLVAANTAYTMIDSIGGVIGLFIVGAMMDHFGTDGLPYTIIAGCVVYFIFALSRYRFTV